VREAEMIRIGKEGKGIDLEGKGSGWTGIDLRFD